MQQTQTIEEDPAEEATARQKMPPLAVFSCPVDYTTDVSWLPDRAALLPVEPPARRELCDTAPVPRVTLTRDEAAAALGFSLDSFERYVQPEILIIRRGRLRLIDIEELRRWAADAGERTIP